MKSTKLLVLAAIVYIVAAWSVAPGFYDGFAPPQQYNFVCPPPQAGANSQPTSGHLNIKIINGSSDPNSAFTDDGQLVIGFLPGAFDVTGKSSVNVTITPVAPCPTPSGLLFVTNTYLITADAPLVKSSNLVMRYSNVAQDPSYIYRAKSLDGPWTKLDVAQQAQLWTISTQTDQLGYFGGGFPANAISSSSSSSSSQEILPIIVAGLIVAVLLAGVPLAVMRRRPARAGGRPKDEDEDDA